MRRSRISTARTGAREATVRSGKLTPMTSVSRPAPPLLALLAVLVATTLGSAWAQIGPNVALLGPDTVRPGDSVRIEVDGLSADVDYTLRVEGPDGGEVVRTVTPMLGQVAAEVAFENEGRHLIWIEGPDLQARFAVEVQPAAAATPPPADPAPADGAAQGEPGRAPPTQPDAQPEAQPDTQPEATPEADAPPQDAPAEPGAEVADEPSEEPSADPAGPALEPDEPAAAEDGAAPAPQDPASIEPAPGEAEAPVPDEGPSAAAPDGVTLLVEDDAVVAREPDGSVRWRLSFAPFTGGPQLALTHLGRGWVAVGHQVLTVDLASGAIEERVATSGTVVDLRPVGTGLSVLSEVVTPDRRLAIEARLADGTLTPVAVFDPTSTLFDTLVNEANVADPAARLALDPTNPFLHLAAARAAATETDRQASIEAALASATTFYDFARLARAFAAQGWWEAADEAMALAAADFRERGYDPALLTSVEIHERYGFPLQPLESALGRNDLVAADLWARWTYELSGPHLPGVGTALRAYAAALANVDDRAGAALWRERAGERTNPVVADVIARAALALGNAGRYAVAALLIALAALHLTLMAKYARARALAVRQAREAGRSVPAWPWTRSIRYYGLTEKLVLIMLLASVVVVVALAGWTQRTDPVAHLVAAGHLAAPGLAVYGQDPEAAPVSAAWVEAYRADREGDPDRARAVLEAAGVPSERALAAAAAGEPLPAPAPHTIRAAAGGTWYGAIARPFRDPLSLLEDESRLDGIARWAWPALVVLLALVMLIHVLALFVPRPRLARHAPRPLGYHVLALLLPGSGQADELYGILLLIPWAVFGIDVVVQLTGGSTLLGIRFGTGVVVLAVLYAFNVIAWAVELSSVRKRHRELRETEPELAYAYGLAPARRSTSADTIVVPELDG